MAETLLIAGGVADANLAGLAEAAAAEGVPHRLVAVDPDRPPGITWQLGGALEFDGEPLQPSAMFCRYDVFSTLQRPDPAVGAAMSAWYATFTGYALVTGLRMLNAGIDPVTASKPAMLALAMAHGLPIPATTITNSVEQLDDAANRIAKPVAGGSYAMRLADALDGSPARYGVLAAPAIVQPLLAYPERRVYRVGRRLFAFDILAATLDARLDAAGEVRAIAIDQVPQPVIDGILALTDRVRCDFCAIDFKTDPRTGDLVFLELNNGPMFVGYDRAAGGEMAREMVRVLMDRHSGPAAG
ncbi:MAG: hypothetical protein EOP19_23870 [Hyphomicrobiales bacterium]|nr:MAG: hypothetical protein EOP19_23870 [Hyphomicrobiales bacterium]